MHLYLFGLLIYIILSLISLSESKIWALLVAGSNGYDNYRHQADVCHAYQIFRHRKVPAENIITMMYDDIANSKENPFPGNIINQPDGKNVYAGVAKDYTKEDVSPKNFINVLLGDKTAMTGIGTGRVIESGPDDIVFVNYVGHGGYGIFGFPSSFLYVKELNDTLSLMISQKKFKKLILHIEACRGGSMFDDILVYDANIFVMSATDPNENSFGCYYDEKRNAFLGDVFSVNWMQESEKENLTVRSMHHIFHRVRTGTLDFSHVQEYGDLDIGNSSISEILGSPKFIKSTEVFDTYREDAGKDAVDSYDVPLQVLQKKLQKLENMEAQGETQLVQDQIKTVLEKRQLVKNVMNELILQMADKNIRFSSQLRNKKVSINRRNIDCYDKVLQEFSKTCFNLAKNPFVGSQLHVLLNACDLFDNKESKIIHDIQLVCGRLVPVPMTDIV